MAALAASPRAAAAQAALQPVAAVRPALRRAAEEARAVPRVAARAGSPAVAVLPVSLPVAELRALPQRVAAAQQASALPVPVAAVALPA